MLALKDYRSTAFALPDLLPYAACVAPGVVLCKDGSFLAAWEVTGRDTASSTPDELAWVSSQVSHGVQMLSTGWMIHVDAIRSPQRAYPPDRGFFPDEITAMIDAERRAFFQGELCYSTTTILTVTFRPDVTEAQLARAVRTNNGNGKVDPLEKALHSFQQSIREFEDALSSVLTMQRLGEHYAFDSEGNSYLQSDLLAHLQFCVSGTVQPVRVPEIPMYLDALLAGADLIGGLEPQLGEYHLATLAIDGFPQESWPSMLASLDRMPVSYRYSTRFICLGQHDAIKEVNSYRKGWKQQIYRLIDQLTENPGARANRDAARMHEDAEEALVMVQGGLLGFGFLTSNIVLLDKDQTHLIEIAREFRRTLQSSGFGCRIETINALEAWLSTHPGNWYANVRRPLINTLNLADLLPLATVWTGSPVAPCPFYPPNSSPLAVLTTDGSTPFFLNLHDGDLGHTCIFGPPGSGKSTLLALIAAQFRRYEESSLFVFDKGNSIYSLCMAAGDHYDVGEGSLSFAPLYSIDESEAEFTWAANWLSTLAELQKLTVLPAHKKAIHQALDSMRHNPPSMRSLSDFCMIVQNQEVKDALAHYTLQGALGHLLDAKEDALKISSFLAFEIESLMEMGEANLIPVLLYLFRRIEKSLTGQPAMLILDEAWVMLGHPTFREKIREWLKVFRKANCVVILATQSLSDAKRSGIFDVILDSCPTKILLPNHAARQDDQAALYTDVGLNARQIEIIAAATPKRDYYILSPSGRRLVQLALGRKTLAFVGVSDKDSIARIRTLTVEHGRNWPAIWLNERGEI
jgi:type IV secretion system protein VirB4